MNVGYAQTQEEVSGSSTGTAFLVKGMCFESLSQHQSKSVTEAVPGRALWKPAKPLKSERTFIVKQFTIKQNHFQGLGKVIYSK